MMPAFYVLEFLMSFDVPTKDIWLDNPEVEIIVETSCRSWGKLLI